MSAPECIVIDFETYPIRQRPEYPPRPVGVAIKWPGERSQYYTGYEMVSRLNATWDLVGDYPVLCHNAKFDLAVACEGGGFKMPAWDQFHDTMFLAYLYDPHARALGLKELCADILNWPTDEQNELNDWIWQHRADLERAHGGKVKKSKLGEWILAAPTELVAKYACGDVDRTAALFEHLWPIIQNEGMGRAYDRERQLMPILMENERDGMRVALEQLGNDVQLYGSALDLTEEWMRRELQASGLNFDSDRDVANVLLTRGIVPKENWSLTESKQLSMSKDTLLPKHFSGPQGAQIASALGYRNRLKTCLTMFMEPWLEQASLRNGVISTNWNQVRNPEGGTRTGRPSTSDPNFLNISKSFDGRTDGYRHPSFLSVPELPLCRKYILPDEGHAFLHRDFDGQELRVFAHFEQSALFDAYRSNANLDPHAFVSEQIVNLTGKELERTKVKVLNFQALYGGGVPAAQRKLDCSADEAKAFKQMHDKALPGRKHLSETIQHIVRSGAPIRTWGGRYYRPETPRVVDGRIRSFEYKLINYIVQGSAADLTKQAIIDWHKLKETARFMVTVYDEINITAPADYAHREMILLKEAMNAPRLTVPMTSSPKHGPTWGDAKKCKPEAQCPICQ